MMTDELKNVVDLFLVMNNILRRLLSVLSNFEWHCFGWSRFWSAYSEVGLIFVKSFVLLIFSFGLASFMRLFQEFFIWFLDRIVKTFALHYYRRHLSGQMESFGVVVSVITLKNSLFLIVNVTKLEIKPMCIINTSDQCFFEEMGCMYLCVGTFFVKAIITFTKAMFAELIWFMFWWCKTMALLEVSYWRLKGKG